MRDVASLSGVSLKTVSRVINREPGVAPDTASRVSEAVDRLGFRPNLTASNLRRSDQKTSTIGVLLENVANPFSSSLHRGIEEVCVPRGVAVFAASVDEDPDRERSLVAEFVERRVDGLLIVPASHDQSYLIDEMKAGTRVVFVDRPSGLSDVDRVLVDNRDASRRAVQHLMAHGHERIAYLGDLTSIFTAQERFEGYRDAHLANRARLDERLVVDGLHDSNEAEAATIELLGSVEAPTAIYASQNLVTVGVVRALRQLRRSGEVAVVGFDDFALADLLEPAITVVSQHPVEVGRIAAELLLQRLDGDTGAARELIVPTTFVERGSGEIRPR